MDRSRWARVALVGLFLAGLGPDFANAQLRPLDPVDWSIFQPGASVSGSLGFGVLQKQRASLAGVEGRLVEWGNFAVGWRSGRVALIASGTGVRTFVDRTRFEDPLADVTVEFGERRRDAGDYRIETVTRLTPASWPHVIALRFGTRLPTTDEKIGLDRDQTDFYATVAGRVAGGSISASGEAGVGIHGTRFPDFGQADVLLYAVVAEWQRGPVRPFLAVAGQKDGFRGWEIRGNEDLGEWRFGARIGERFGARLAWVRGYHRFSPRNGLLISAELRR